MEKMKVGDTIFIYTRWVGVPGGFGYTAIPAVRPLISVVENRELVASTRYGQALFACEIVGLPGYQIQVKVLRVAARLKNPPEIKSIY